MRPKLEFLIKLLPYLTGFIIVCSVLKSVLFYRIFGIDILNYLDLSECIMNSLDFFGIVLFMFISIVLIFENSIPRKTRISLLYEGVLDQEFDEGLSERTIEKARRRRYIVDGIIILIGCMISAIGHKKFFLFFGMYLIFFLGFFIMWVFTIKTINRIYVKLNFYRMIIILIAAFLLFSHALTGTLEAFVIKYDHKYSVKSISITLRDNRAFKSSDSLIYLDKTKNYIFFWNPKNDSKTIIPTSEIVNYNFY